MARKRRLPIEQLREAAKVSEDILRKRGLHTKDSAIEEIDAQNKVMMPGLPPYLPHRWSLQASRTIMGDIVVMWINETKGTSARREDHREFFRFMVGELAQFEEKYRTKVEHMPEFLKALKGTVLLARVFKPMQEMETTHTMNQFLIDAFNVFVALHMDATHEVQNFTVSDFVFWFDEWTKKLDSYWLGQPS